MLERIGAVSKRLLEWSYFFSWQAAVSHPFQDWWQWSDRCWYGRGIGWNCWCASWHYWFLPWFLDGSLCWRNDWINTPIGRKTCKSVNMYSLWILFLYVTLKLHISEFPFTYLVRSLTLWIKIFMFVLFLPLFVLLSFYKYFFFHFILHLSRHIINCHSFNLFQLIYSSRDGCFYGEILLVWSYSRTWA